jgi:hypothetical protein
VTLLWQPQIDTMGAEGFLEFRFKGTPQVAGGGPQNEFRYMFGGGVGGVGHQTGFFTGFFGGSVTVCVTKLFSARLARFRHAAEQNSLVRPVVDVVNGSPHCWHAVSGGIRVISFLMSSLWRRSAALEMGHNGAFLDEPGLTLEADGFEQALQCVADHHVGGDIELDVALDVEVFPA